MMCGVKNMSKDEEPRNPKYVTSMQCNKTQEFFQKELKTIKNALIGDDMRGGIVKDIADMKSNNGLSKRERFIIYTTFISTVGLIIVESIKVFA